MSLPFYIVYQVLEWLSDLTGLRYEEVNVIVYFVIAPAIFFGLIDKILRRPICTLSFAVALGIASTQIRDFSAFSDSLFDLCVEFLLGFSRFGIGYDAASLLICVLIPLILFLILANLAFPDEFQKRLPVLSRILARFARRESPEGQKTTPGAPTPRL